MTVETIDAVCAAPATDVGGPEDKLHVLCMRCMRTDKSRARRPAAVCGYVKPTEWKDSFTEGDGKPRQICKPCEGLLDSGAPCARCGAPLGGMA